MSVAISAWRCASASCVRDLPESHQGGQPCPFCGHIGRISDVSISETVEALSSVRLQQRRPGVPAKRRVRVDDFQGYEEQKSTGKLVKKARRIDRDTDTYFEHVEDRDGNVIRHCEEPLGEHQARASAKFKKKPPTR